MKLLKEWGPFALFIIVMLLLRVYVWQPVIVEGHSMDPTLADKERLVIIRTASIKRQDIVVAKELNKETNETKNIVKRVIGLPGDTISFKNDVLMVNDKVVKEPYPVPAKITWWQQTMIYLGYVLFSLIVLFLGWFVIKFLLKI